MGGGTFHGGGGVAYPWGADFGPYVVDGWQGVASIGGGGSISLIKPEGLLQY